MKPHTDRVQEFQVRRELVLSEISKLMFESIFAILNEKLDYTVVGRIYLTYQRKALIGDDIISTLIQKQKKTHHI